MLGEQTRLVTQLHRLLDIGLTTVAFMAAYLMKKYEAGNDLYLAVHPKTQ